MRSLVVILAALTLVSCSRDPNAAKKRYLENGNKYFAKGKFKEASIMYRNALQKDQRYGSAYYHLAQTDLKLGRISNALGELRRAIELIPKDQPEHIDSEVRLAEIYLAFTPGPPIPDGSGWHYQRASAARPQLLRRPPADRGSGLRAGADQFPRGPQGADRNAAGRGHRGVPQSHLHQDAGAGPQSAVGAGAGRQPPVPGSRATLQADHRLR